MPRTLSAEFETRRDAEMTVEHLVQEHGIDRSAVTILPVSDRNTSGMRVAGSDTEGGADKGGTDAEPMLSGRLKVSVDAPDAKEGKVLETFAAYKGQRIED